MGTRLAIFTAALALLALSALPVSTQGAEKRPANPPDIDPRAANMVRQMSDYLSGIDRFSLQASTTMEVVTPSDMTLDADRELDIFVRRPDGLRVNSFVPDRDRQFVYDGKTLTIYSPTHNYYTVIPAPATINETIADIRKRGIEFPLADLVLRDPYDAIMRHARHVNYVGQSLVGGVKCNHIAFRGKDMDWQLWIQEGATPLPMRVVITDRASPRQPKHTATITKWDTSGAFTADTFAFTPPDGARKIPFVPASPSTARPRAR